MEAANLLTIQWDKSKVLDWLQEDIPSFDYGGFVVGTYLFALFRSHYKNYYCAHY